MSIKAHPKADTASDEFCLLLEVDLRDFSVKYKKIKIKKVHKDVTVEQLMSCPAKSLKRVLQNGKKV